MILLVRAKLTPRAQTETNDREPILPIRSVGGGRWKDGMLAPFLTPSLLFVRWEDLS